MKRLHLIELQDLGWFPSSWRDMLTDYMNYGNSLTNPYESVIPRVRELLDRLGCEDVLDLCSGGSGAWTQIHQKLDTPAGSPRKVMLSDKFPSESAQERVRRAGIPSLTFLATPVDALAVEGVSSCFRTLFSSFHHFRPERAREILADAVRSNVGIGVFETTERSIQGVLANVAAPLVMLVVTPWIRPFSWKRLLWTYLLPAMPLCILWDGVISSLRTYTVSELKDMAESLDTSGYEWEIGHFGKAGVKGTYLLGYQPNGPTFSRRRNDE